MYNEIIFLIGAAAILGAFLILACLIMAVLIVFSASQHLRDGWTLGEAFKMAKGEWK